jgi:hypothetical protein
VGRPPFRNQSGDRPKGRLREAEARQCGSTPCTTSP